MSRKKIIAIVVLILVVIVLIAIMKSNKDEDNGNISNMGLVCNSGNTVYYNKYEKGIFSYKDGKENRLTDQTAYSLNLVGNKIYFITVEDFNSVVIKSVDIDGQNLKSLATIYTTISKIYVDKNHIYYATNETDKGIARVDLNGQNEEVVLAEAVLDFQVKNGIIYYVNSANQILRKSVDKDDAMLLKEEAVARKIQVIDNWIYYYDTQENALFRVKNNGSKQELISILINNEIYNIYGKYVYYFDKENSKICRMQINKSNNCQDIVNLNVSKTKINISGNEIYYLDKSKDESQTYQIFRIKTNGKETKSIEY